MTLEHRKSLMPYIYDEVEYYPHQLEGIRTMLKMKSFILADDMGLGKSLQALTVFAIDVKQGLSETCIVVAPPTLKGNWADEIEKFSTFQYQVLEGDPRTRDKQLLSFAMMTGPKILIVNYEQVVIHKGFLNELRFDVAVFDEAHKIKNPKSDRTKACLDLFSKRSFMLTGTPMLNFADELWTLLHRCAPNTFPDYWKFLRRYVLFGGFQGKAKIGIKNKNELITHLNKYMIRRLKKDVLNLPEVQIIERRVTLNGKQLDLYEQAIKELKLPDHASGEERMIENALTKFLRLKQLCGTTRPFTGTDDSAKLDLAIEDDIELLRQGHKIVTFTQFREVLDCYHERLEVACKKAKITVPIFQLHGDVPKPNRVPITKQWASVDGPAVIACIISVAGVGLTMTASRHGSFLDEMFTPGENQQAIDRLNRIGASETQPIQIRKYITRNTVENRVQAILRTKSAQFEEIIESGGPTWKAQVYAAIQEGLAA